MRSSAAHCCGSGSLILRNLLARMRELAPFERGEGRGDRRHGANDTGTGPATSKRLWVPPVCRSTRAPPSGAVFVSRAVRRIIQPGPGETQQENAGEQEMALTKCPDCGTEISTEAPVCPKCGRPNAPAKKKPGTISTGWGVIIIIAAIIGWVWWLSSGTDDSSGRASDTSSDSASTAQDVAAPDESRPIQTYTAEQLYAMFHANEIKANNTIGNALVRFTGIIGSIEKSDFSNTPELQIRSHCFNLYDCEDPDAWNTFEADLTPSEISTAAGLKIAKRSHFSAMKSACRSTSMQKAA